MPSSKKNLALFWGLVACVVGIRLLAGPEHGWFMAMVTLGTIWLLGLFWLANLED